MPLKLNGYSASVRCDGEELEHYDAKQDNPRTASCWIASESGRSFTVHWGDASADTVMKVVVRVDGRIMVRQAHQSQLSGSFSEVIDQPGQHRVLHFSPLVLSDEESSTVLSADLGTIEVQMWRVDKFVPSENHYSLGDIAEIGTVHEKSKKAGVHVVSLGAAKAETPRKALRDVGVESEPFAIFLFRYRPLELLQANDIAPLPKRTHNKKKRPTIPSARVTPEAGPSNPKRRRTSGVEDEPQVKAELDGGEEDDDRVTFLEEQIAMLQNRLAEEKAKKGKTPVKREVSPISVPAAWTNEVIDLT